MALRLTRIVTVLIECCVAASHSVKREVMCGENTKKKTLLTNARLSLNACKVASKRATFHLSLNICTYSGKFACVSFNSFNVSARPANMFEPR